MLLFVVPVVARGQTPKAAAPMDLTGYWISHVSEDWKFRMTTPPKGDFGFGLDPQDPDVQRKRMTIPLNGLGRQVALNWDPAKDEAEGNQCKAYGAAGIMWIPERLHITWENDNTLRIDTDAGMQTRLFYFGAAPPLGGRSTWQGVSVAQWLNDGNRESPRAGRLKVVTTMMRPGYYWKNGMPYSENAVMTEHFRRVKLPTGEDMMIVTIVVEDPQYLAGNYIRSANFLKLPDASGWNPTPCSVR
jgi:hypothetical protein